MGLPHGKTGGEWWRYGEIVNINLVRDRKSGKSKGFCYICFEDQRSTVLAVDNLNGIKLLGRILRVDHVEEYKKPKEHGDEDDVTLKVRNEGCAPQIPNSPESMSEEDPLTQMQKETKLKKEKKGKKKKKKRKVKQSSSECESRSDSNQESIRTKPSIVGVTVKREKLDSGYDQAINSSHAGTSARGFKRSHSPGANIYPPKQSKSTRLYGGSNRNRDDDDNDGNDDRQRYMRNDEDVRETRERRYGTYSNDREKKEQRYDNRYTTRHRENYVRDRDDRDYEWNDRRTDPNDRCNNRRLDREIDRRRNERDNRQIERGRDDRDRGFEKERYPK